MFSFSQHIDHNLRSREPYHHFLQYYNFFIYNNSKHTIKCVHLKESICLVKKERKKESMSLPFAVNSWKLGVNAFTSSVATSKSVRHL